MAATMQRSRMPAPSHSSAFRARPAMGRATLAAPAAAPRRRPAPRAASARPRQQGGQTVLATASPAALLGGRGMRRTAAGVPASAARPRTAPARLVAARRPSRGRATGAVRVEANLFSRIFRVIKAAVDSLVSSFEDPERLLDRIVVEVGARVGGAEHHRPGPRPPALGAKRPAPRDGAPRHHPTTPRRPGRQPRLPHQPRGTATTAEKILAG
jgi:hypothetical protein